MQRLRRLARTVGRVLAAALYVLLLAAIAFGSAGVAAVASHPPGTAARAELTYAGDAVLTPALDQAQAKLDGVGTEVDRLAVLARGALASLNADDTAALSDALTQGGTVATSIDTDSTALDATLLGLGGGEPTAPLRYGGDVLARRAAMLAALDSTSGLARSWATLTAASLQAANLVNLLGEHDLTVAAAAAQGRAENYAAALTTLATASADLAQATEIRNQLANAVDVSTLDQWLARNRTYDAALGALYSALVASQGRVTTAVRVAFQAEARARAQLPPDTRGLVVIVADIGRGGLNQAVIAIEQARGRLDLALQGLDS